MQDRILIIDFGSQVTQLIARRIREAGVYSEIVPFQSAERALEIISENSGTQFDPAIVEVFLRIMKSEALNLTGQLEALNANLRAQQEQQEKGRLTHDVF